MSTTITPPTAEAPSEPSYVQSLLNPAVDEGTTAAIDSPEPQSSQAVAETTTAPETAKTADKPAEGATTAALPTLDELIQQFAKEMGYDANDPGQRKTLKRLADKELFIRKLQADNETLKHGTTPATPGAEFLTDFEKELIAEAKPAAPATGQPAAAAPATAPAAPATPAAAPSYGDVGDAWKTPEESLTALNDAWAKNDLKGVHEIEVARMRRNFDSLIAPQLLTFVEKMLEKRLQGFVEKDLGDIVPEARRSAVDRRVATSRDFAIDQLRKAGAADIDKLFEVEDGPPINFDGQEFPNTPLNRILARHPEILQITAQHADPSKAERKSFIARYKLAYQLMKQQPSGVVPIDTAKQLVDAGRTAKDRETADRTRQAINAGPGASGVGVDSKTPKSYVSELNSLPGEVPLSSLLS